MKTTSKYTFFWHGIFSNWHMSKFIVHDMEFNCGEQWMMFCKASLFKDKVASDKIMKSTSPKEIKAIGRTVEQFDPERWDEVGYDVIKIGLREKFKQNDKLYEALMKTGHTTLVEASPYDTIWGIGMSEDHPDVEDETKWQGTNYLGLLLTELRDEFAENER